MFQAFVNSLAENVADVLTVAAIVGVVVGAFLFWRARRRHIADIRRRLHGRVNAPGRVREVLAKVANADVAEMGAIGAVTFVDLAWHYSMANPSIWDHFDGPAADHIADAIQNLDVLKSALGDRALPTAASIIEHLRGLEAVQVFNDLIDRLPSVSVESGMLVLEAKSAPVVDSLVQGTAVSAAADAQASATEEAAALLAHIPLVTIGFATYRAWRRSQKGASLRRNLEFAAVEVATRASGGLVGGKVGGVIGTVIVPGIGTIIGTVTGAVAGAVGGALLGEAVKKRHLQKASRELDESLERLGETYLEDPDRFMQVTNVFREQEAAYIEHLRGTKRRLRRYAMPWRVVWPDEKLVLLQETVRLAEERLGSIQEGTVEAIDKLTFMRETQQHRELGIMLWSNPALCAEISCEGELVEAVETANSRLRNELRHLGAVAA